MSSISAIRSRLVDEKRDRSKPLEPRFVVDLYIEFEQVVQSVEAPEQDAELCDLLHVFSLALMTVGMTRSTPAHYAICITLERLLSHLELRPMFTINEAKVVRHHLNEIRDHLDSPENDELQVSAKIQTVVVAKLSHCFASLDIIENLLGQVAPEDVTLYSQVIHLRRESFGLVIEPDFKPSDFDHVMEKLDQIQHHLETNNHQPSWMLRHHLEACKFVTKYYINGPVPGMPLEEEYHKLLNLNKDLKVFLVTQRWTLRETDLYQYQVDLGEIDLKVVQSLTQSDLFNIPKLDASVEDIQASFRNAGPYLLQFFLVRKAHSLIYKLLENAEPVCEALAPIHNQLLTCKRCLLDVKRLGGISNLQELWPYQMKLSSLEKQRTDGKFLVNAEAPPGQGILNNLLAECFDLVYELEVDLEERPENENEAENYSEDE